MSELTSAPGVSPEVGSFVNEAITTSAGGDVNAGFVLSSAYLVFFMHCGFAMLSIGCVRARFAKHIAILILVDACASAIGYYLFGYAFAFGDHAREDGGDSQNPFIGSQYFALSGLGHDQYYLWVFQWSFAATACTIVSGAIAERAKFESYILYSLFMASWVYPVLTHSIWSTSGWAGMFRSDPPTRNFLLGVGAIDFAGSGAVHMVGGYAAAAGCWILGPRIGRFLPDGTVVDMPGHNTSLFVLGVMILWFGWYGFNPGSQLALVGGNSQPVANAAVTTTLAPSMAGLSALLVKSILGRKKAGRMTYDVGVMGNGALAGLVAITAGCSVVYPWGAIAIGFVAGCLYVVGSMVSVLLKLDDPLDAIAVHAWNGTWGVLAVGFFAGEGLITASYATNPYTDAPRQYGCFLGGNGRLLGAQIIYALWLGGWVLINMIPFWFLLRVCGLLRVPANEETVGLDDSYHGGTAYPGHGPGHHGGDDFLDKSSSRGGGDNAKINGDAAMNGSTGGVNKEELAQMRAEIEAIKSSMAHHQHQK